MMAEEIMQSGGNGSSVASIEEFGTEVESRRAKNRPGMEPPDIEDIEIKSGGYIQWTRLADGIFTHTGPTQKELDASAYTVFRNDQGLFLRKEKIASDDLIEFKDSITDQILTEIELFWDSKKKFQKYGFLHRRGYIFYGPAGCGKSGIIYLVLNKVIKRNGIVLICSDHPSLWIDAVKMIRNVEPERHIVAILEDIDAIIEQYGEERVLSFLDGESQCDDILNIATTNYAGRLDRRIISRPRRFDRRIKIFPPSESIRREYFMKKMKITEKEVEKWVNASDGFSFAGLTDLVIQVKCLQAPFDEAVKKLKDLMGKLPNNSDDEFNSVGFNTDA